MNFAFATANLKIETMRMRRRFARVFVDAGGVGPMIAKHAGRNRKIAHSYQRRRRVQIKLL